MADLATVHTFFNNPDAYAAFLARVETAVVERALLIRADDPPDPVTGAWAARQAWAAAVLKGGDYVRSQGEDMLPALAVTANDAGLIDESGNIDATDTQIRATIGDTFVDWHAGYYPLPPD